MNQYRRAHHLHQVHAVVRLNWKEFQGWNEWLGEGFVRLEYNKLTAGTVPDLGGSIFCVRLARVC